MEGDRKRGKETGRMEGDRRRGKGDGGRGGGEKEAKRRGSREYALKLYTCCHIPDILYLNFLVQLL